MRLQQDFPQFSKKFQDYNKTLICILSKFIFQDVKSTQNFRDYKNLGYVYTNKTTYKDLSNNNDLIFQEVKK